VSLACGAGHVARTSRAGIKRSMPREVEAAGSAVHVRIVAPMDGEWERLLDAVVTASYPQPYAIYLPSRIEGASGEDANLLRELWDVLGKRGVLLLPSKDES
jgi:hypothetical protein